MRRGTGRAMAATAAMAGLGLLAALAIATAQAAGPGEIEHVAGTVRTPEQPGPRVLDVWMIEGVPCLDLDEVARIFHATKYWRPELEKMVLKVNGHRVRVTVGSPYVFVDDTGHNMLMPARWLGPRLVVPVTLLTDVLDPLLTESVSWDAERRRLRVDTGDPNVLGVSWDVRRNGTVVTVRLARPLDGALEWPRPDRVVLRIPGGVLPASLEGGVPGRGLVDSLETAQDPGAAALVFHLGPMGGTAELLTRRSPPRLVLAFSEGLPDDIPLPEFARDSTGTAGRRPLRRIVIDPGHGGSETGVVASSLTEKEVVLDVARRLVRLLEDDPDLEVVLTRDSDRWVAPADRAGRANGADADLMLSIHADGWFDPGRRGFAVGLSRTTVTDPGDAELVPWGARPASADRDAALFAEILRDALGEATGMPDRGVRTAPYVELAGARMAAVHLECGMLTNARDAALLGDPGWRDGLAAAVAGALAEYRRALVDEGRGTP